MPEATAQEAKRLFTLEMLRELTRRQKLKLVKQLEKQAGRAHEREIAPTPSFTVGMLKKGEFLAQSSGMALGTIPYIGILFRLAAGLARRVLKTMRVPLEWSTRRGLRKEELEARKTATALRKKWKLPAQTAATAHGGGGGGIPIPFFSALRPDDKPVEILGFFRINPRLYRFLVIMFIGFLVIGGILLIAAMLAFLCEPGLTGALKRFLGRIGTGASVPCP